VLEKLDALTFEFGNCFRHVIKLNVANNSLGLKRPYCLICGFLNGELQDSVQFSGVLDFNF
jgi:hypothetical protein